MRIQKDYNNRFNNGVKYIINYINNDEIAISNYITGVYLFGSVAKGNNRFDSDIDILICFSDTIKQVPDYKRKIRMIKSDLSYINDDIPEIDVKIFIGNDWLTDMSQFCCEIRKDGIQIWH